MSYITPTEIEEFMGIAYTDLKINGESMDDNTWITFVENYQVPIAELIHRYCRVPTFDPTSSRALVVEYRNGKGSTYDDAPYVRGYSGLAAENEYTETDISFYLRNLYFTGSVNINGVSTARAPVVVEEDTACKTAIPAWTART